MFDDREVKDRFCFARLSDLKLNRIISFMLYETYELVRPKHGSRLQYLI